MAGQIPCNLLCPRYPHARLSTVKSGHCIVERSAQVRVAVFALLASVLSSVLTIAPAAEPSVKTFELRIPRDAAAAPTRVLRVEKGDLVQLRIASEAAGEIHFHAYRLDATVMPGVPAELNFKARATGRFRIEWHPAGQAEKKGHLHAPPLATLEVRPK